MDGWGEKKLRGVHVCQRSSNFIFPILHVSVFSLFKKNKIKFSVDPQCGIISPLYPSSGSLSATAPSFPASPPPELCLPPLCLHFPPTFLSHSKELSVSVLPFIYCFNMLAGGERGGCCAHPSVLSCHPSGQCRLSLTPTQLPVVSA